MKLFPAQPINKICIQEKNDECQACGMVLILL